jgi:hypothetical protein
VGLRALGLVQDLVQDLVQGMALALVEGAACSRLKVRALVQGMHRRRDPIYRH